jgi:hypothetical protein
MRLAARMYFELELGMALGHAGEKRPELRLLIASDERENVSRLAE